MPLNCVLRFLSIHIWTLIYNTRGRKIEIEDIPPLDPDLYIEALTDSLQLAYKAQKGLSAASKLRGALWKCFRYQHILVGVLAFSSEISMLGVALALRAFLITEVMKKKIFAGLILLVLIWFDCTAKRLYEDAWRNAGCRMKIAVRGLILRCLLRKTQISNEGRLANLLNADVEKIYLVPRCSHFLWVTPLCCMILVFVIGLLHAWDALLGFVILFLFIIFSVGCEKLSVFYTKRYKKATDRRLNAIQESINGIYSVKVFRMEAAILKLVENYRVKELYYLLRQSLTNGMNNLLVYIVKFPVLLTVITAHFLLHGKVLCGSYIFPLALLYQWAQDISTFRISVALKEWMEFNVAIVRFGDFIEQDCHKENDNHNTVVEFRTELVKNRTKFYHIVGDKGCGKTTFAQDLVLSLSETPLKIAFSVDKPWLLNTTIRENILCGRSYDPYRYWKTISACQLDVDLNHLENSDQSEVGESGVKLSGGQRARVALARAVYTVAEVYIFDDPFKSLNAAVSAEIFKNVLLDVLKKRTRVLVGSKQELSEFSNRIDFVYRLRRGFGLEEVIHDLAESQSDFLDDQVSAQDRETQCNGSKDLLYCSETPSYTDIPHNCEVQHNGVGDNKENLALLQQKNKEKINRHTIRKIFRYFRFAPLWLSITTLALLIGGQVVMNLSDVWLYIWVMYPESHQQWFYLKVYAGIATFGTVLAIVRAMALRYLCFVIARNVHNRVVHKVVRAPMQFFWDASSGEVHSRFSTDLMHLDAEIPLYIDFALQAVIAILGFVVTIGTLYPIAVLALLPSLVLVAVIRWISVSTGQEMQVFYANSLAPLVEKFVSVASGLFTVRAHHFENYVEATVFKLCDLNSAPMLATIHSNVFLIHGVGVVFVLLISILVLVILLSHSQNAAAGLALYYGMQLMNRCRFTAYVTGYLELLMIHFHRLLEYTNIQIEDDAESRIEHKPGDQVAQKSSRMEFQVDRFSAPARNSRELDERQPAKKLSEVHDVQNTTNYAIAACNVGVKYEGCSQWVLKDLSLAFENSKVTGIAGRTGCGKSTFLSALLRMVDFEGNFLIGDRDSKNMSLAELRSYFAVLPQESIILDHETVRWNLDPYKILTDEAIWEALDVLGIKEDISRLRLGLGTLVKDAELSWGQKRLFCFSRVLLMSKGKILLLDEPTDSVDFATEGTIWEAIRKKLPDHTILVVAHSTNLLDKCDEVIQLS